SPLCAKRDLAKLIPLWPREIEDQSTNGALHILAKLRRALRAERTRGLAGHWSYDLNRHLGLLSAFKGELASYRRCSSTAVDLLGLSRDLDRNWRIAPLGCQGRHF